jgi:hypothetical protein
LTALEPLSIKSVCIDFLLVHVHQTAEIESMSASGAISAFAVNEFLLRYVFPTMDASKVYASFYGSNFPSSDECGVNDFDKANPASIDEGDVKGLDPLVEVSFCYTFL